MYDFVDDLLKWKDRIAFKFNYNGSIKEITYQTYYNNIFECLNIIQKKFGNIKNRHIGIALGNCYEYLVLIPAIIMGNGVVVPLNILESKNKLKSIVIDADIDFIITKDKTDDTFGVKNVVVLSEICSFKNDNRYCLKENRDFDSKALIVYTSGTTGKAKGVVISYRNLFCRKRNALPRDYYENPQKDDPLNVMLTFPMYHLAGVECWLSWCGRGFTTFINGNAGDILFDLKNNNIEFSFVSPAVMKILGKKIRRGDIRELGSIKGIGSCGAPVEKEIIELFVRNGINYCQIYGMTETSGEVTYNGNNEEELISSVGKAVEGVDLRIIDGEICVAAECNSKGYYKDNVSTEELIVNGYIHTGDLGYINESGYVYIIGRKKNLIILSGGENVSPEELEAQLYTNMLIKECRIIEHEDRICAEIYSRNEDREEIEGFVLNLNKKLPIFKRINKIFFREKDFEKTVSGKIRRKKDE